MTIEFQNILPMGGGFLQPLQNTFLHGLFLGKKLKVMDDVGSEVILLLIQIESEI